MSRSIIITGGFGVLGQAVTERFVSVGDKVACIDLAQQAAFPIEAWLGIGGVDLTDPLATGDALARASREHGGIDVLVNVAGGFSWETLESDNLATWAAMHAANLATTANVIQLALPGLKSASHGRIVNVGAAAALKAEAGMGPYAASKAGVHRLTEALA